MSNDCPVNPCPVLKAHMDDSDTWRQNHREDSQAVYHRLNEIEKAFAVQDAASKDLKESMDQLTKSVDSLKDTLTMGKGAWWLLVTIGATIVGALTFIDQLHNFWQGRH